MMNFLKRWWPLTLIAVLPFERIPSLDVAFAGHSVTLRLSILLAAIGLVVIGPTLLNRLRPSLSSPYLWLTLYLVVICLSAFGSLDRAHSLIVIIATLLTVGAGVVLSRLVGASDLPGLEKVLLVSATVAALFGLYQFVGDSFGLSTAWTGLRPNYTKAVFDFPRIQSTGLEPLFFANYLLLPLMVAIAGLYARARSGWIAYLRLLLFVVVLILTLSRGGIVAAGVGLALLGLLLRRQGSWRSAGLIVSTAVLGIAIAIGSIYLVTNFASHSAARAEGAVKNYVHQSTTLASSSTTPDSDRVLDRKLATQAFKERPVLGYGIGSFGAYAHRAQPVMYNDPNNLPTVNNEYYEVLAETGVLGALALLGFVLTLAWRAWRRWQQKLDLTERVWLSALVVTGIGYGIQYYAFSTLYIPHIWVTAGLLLALTAPAPDNARALAARR